MGTVRRKENNDEKPENFSKLIQINQILIFVIFALHRLKSIKILKFPKKHLKEFRIKFVFVFANKSPWTDQITN